MSDLIPLSEATKVERLDSHVYKANLADSFCIGTGKSGSPPVEEYGHKI
jgi:hypothetical protein